MRKIWPNPLKPGLNANKLAYHAYARFLVMWGSYNNPFEAMRKVILLGDALHFIKKIH